MLLLLLIIFIKDSVDSILFPSSFGSCIIKGFVLMSSKANVDIIVMLYLLIITILMNDAVITVIQVVVMIQ